MKHVFGPVPSRRLGYSLGVDILPAKYCTYDCIYCQIGKTTNKEIVRQSFFDPDVIVGEIIEKISSTQPLDFITFSGSGEPTLNSDLRIMIKDIKKRTGIPVAVITNGSLLCQEDVREDLLDADVVLPSLDAVSEDIFRYINRPHLMLDIEEIIEGMKLFRRDYTKVIWLEIMLIKNVNNEPDELKRMKEIVAGLGADRVQLNTVTRPPSEESTGKLQNNELAGICELFGPSCEIICSFEGSSEMPSQTEWSKIIIETLKRHPLTLDDIIKITNMSYYQAKNKLLAMEKQGLIKSYSFDNNLFFIIP